MKVSELIELLGKVDKDKEVLIASGDEGLISIEPIESIGFLSEVHRNDNDEATMNSLIIKARYGLCFIEQI